MAHAIVVGGTGMLREVSLFLAKHDNTVSVIGLEHEDLVSLAQEAQTFNGRINPLLIDYRDQQALRDGLLEAMRFFGPITLAVAWILPEALPDTANALAAVISEHSPVCRYFQVLPSTGLGAKDRRFLDNPFPGMDKMLYRKIILGFKMERGMSIWLSNEEISDGVIRALRDDKRDMLIGTADPHQSQPRTA
jgi:hypothetical protein